jgi:predicted ribosome quality control (RQC) complex YloA/Tae2 family protein
MQKGWPFLPTLCGVLSVKSPLDSELLGVSHMSQTEKSVIPFAPMDKGNDQLDKAGQSILNLLHKAAGVAEQNSQQALDIAQKLSHQLRAAEQRIADLEAEAETHRDSAERAEQWLHKVYSEIEERFLRQESGRARTNAR